MPALQQGDAVGDAKKVLFKYKFPETYNPVYANGAHGGITPQGELCLNFFLERQPVPNKETYGFSDDGRVTAKPIEFEPVDKADAVFVRYVSTGVVMSMDTARRLMALIQRQLAVFDELNTPATPSGEPPNAET